MTNLYIYILCIYVVQEDETSYAMCFVVSENRSSVLLI